MKELIMEFVHKYKKYVILAGSGILLILIGIISWGLFFSRYKIFYDEEVKFTNAAKRYYEYHQQFLPKDGESKDLTLQDLYDLDQIDDLYVPKSRKMCSTNSWVRTYKDEKGEYKYVTYLECGRYKSRIDHTGPVITLNGDESISIALNTTYEDAGVKKVEDNKDGKMDVNKVVIDTSKVDTSKIGEYEVTYTIKDSNYNKTVVTRTVIVNQSLTDVVRANVREDGYYRENNNNYVLFSGMLFRVVNINEDGSIRMILANSVTNLRANHESYKDSNIDTWLNEVFYNALTNPDKYLVESTYCVGSINSMNDYGNYCSESIKSKVGLLDIDSYYKTFNGNASSIFNRGFALANKIGENYADATFDDTKPAGTTATILAPIRPVITLNNTLNITSGNGTITSPYKLNDYNYGKQNDKINTRLIGEYLEYSGLIFRIIGIDSDENVRLIMNTEWTVQPNNNLVYLSTENLDKWEFNPQDENNPAYIMNNDDLDYISTKSIVTTEYEIPTNDPALKYNEYKTKKVKAKIVIPKTYELFAGLSRAEYMYSYIDSSVNDQMLFMINGSNGKVFELGKDDFNSYSIKGIITLKGNLKIASGKGTVNSPYKLK